MHRQKSKTFLFLKYQLNTQFLKSQLPTVGGDAQHTSCRLGLFGEMRKLANNKKTYGHIAHLHRIKKSPTLEKKNG
jgi:hypothetical protein